VNKKAVLAALKVELEKELVVLKKAALATYEDATHEESKPENKYDTRALEASYLAGAQAKRVKDIEELISICKFQQVRNFNPGEAIAVTAIVEIESGDKINWFLFLPKGGGFTVNFENKKIQVITPVSPLGQALVGLTVGEVATVEMQGKKRDYEILSIV